MLARGSRTQQATIKFRQSLVRRCCCDARSDVFQQVQSKMTLAAPLPSSAGGLDDGRRQARLSSHVDRAGACKLLTAPGTPLEVGEEEIRGIRMKVWKNAPPTLREVYALGAMFAGRDHLVFRG
jgi:hypothetical protein